MKKLNITVLLLLVAFSAICQTKAIRVVKEGNGSPVLFLPGFTTPGSVWQETIKNMDQEKESHLVSYAGFNGIEPIDTPWYGSIKAEVISYIEKEGLENISIIGHSMGGMLAIDIAAAAPDKVDKIILVDAIPCMREVMMPGMSADQILYDSPYSQQMLEMTDEAMTNYATMSAENMTMNSSKVEILKQWSIEADRKTFVYGYIDLLKLDLREILPQVKAKTLILGAPFPNAEIVKANYDAQYAKLGSKHIEIADNSKHFIMFDQPEWFYNHVNTFLANE